MPTIPCFDNESERLLELQRLKAMENIVEKSYGNYTLLASSLCATPAAAISLIDSDHQWFRAPVGLHLKGTDRSISFCTHAIMQDGIYIVNNADEDPLFQDNPLVIGMPRIRFYAGVPLLTSRGFHLGTLCVMDSRERVLSPEQVHVLKQLAEQIVIQLEESMDTAALSVTLTRLHTFLDHMDFATLIEDEEGAVLYVNDAFCHLFPEALALRSSNFKANRVSMLEDIKQNLLDPEAFLDQVENLIVGRRKKSGIDLRMKSGRLLELDYIPTLDDCAYRGHIWIFRDVTESKRLAEQIELQKMQVIQAEKLAVLGEMAAGLAHEINNPLAIIQAQAYFLRLKARKGEMGAELIESTMQSVENTIHRIARIIQGLRSFARDDGKTEPQLVRVQQLIEDALMFCESRIRNHGMRLHIRPFDPDLTIRCRPIQITQVLVNLIQNAFDACRMQPTPEPWIEIQVTSEGDSIILRVVDSGPGIPRAIRDKIMLPFFTTKEIGKGSGLGLSIAKGIVEDHRGRFYLDRTAPHTTFVMSFPRDGETSVTKMY